MTPVKRAFDIGFLLLSLPLMVPLAIVVTLGHLILEGRPLIYRATRAGQNGRHFQQLKFRTLPAQATDQQGVSGGYKTKGISKFARMLRRSRLDELPQLINILRGEMSWVGPRPPDPAHVAMCPQDFARVLRSRPGLTGLATLVLHRYEDRVLQGCATRHATELVYMRRCLPKKIKLDLLYQNGQAQRGGIWFDLWLIGKSVGAVTRSGRSQGGVAKTGVRSRPKFATIRTI